jgi:hypothetical protein
VVGIVQESTGPGRYRVQIQGMLLELELQLFLAPGDRLALRVREQTAGRLVFELAAPREADGRTARESPPGPPELLREMRRQRAPLDPALVDRIAAVSRDAPTRQAAAFLAAHGLEPSAPLVEALSRLAGPAPEPAGDATLLRPLADALAALVADDPSELPAKAGRSVPAAELLEGALRPVLEGSARLRMLDRLIEALSALRPAADAAPVDVAGLLRGAAPETADAWLRQLPPLSREALQEILTALLRMERETLAATPELAQARAARGTLLEAAERLGSLRLVNQLSQLRQDGVTILEIPVRHEGRIRHVPLSIVRDREGERRDPRGGARFAVTLDADLTRLGPVRALVSLAAQVVRVRFRARDRSVKEHLERGSGELVEALRAAGFEAEVTAEVAGRELRESIFDVFAAPGEVPNLDVEA